MLLRVQAGIVQGRIILLPPGEMVSWSHFVKDKGSLIDKVISTFPRSCEPQSWDRRPMPQNCRAELANGLIRNRRDCRKLRSHLLKLPVDAHPCKKFH